jgi:glycosyltransferase involved in cell wall biosynthesis
MMADRALVTIGMPVYNGAPHVEQAIRSLLDQTMGDFTMLISDNCSTDNTYEICERLALEDRRIRLLRQRTNIGAVRNFEQVLRLASSPYFMWAAHDDLWEPRFLEVSLALLASAREAVACAAGVEVVDESGRHMYTVLPAQVGDRDVLIRCRALRNSGWEMIYSLFRRNAIPEGLALPDIPNGDLAFVFRMALRGPFIATGQVLSTRRQIGRVHYVDRDGRMHLRKSHGQDTHLYTERMLPACRAMAIYTLESSLTIEQKARLLAFIARMGIEFSRSRELVQSPLRIHRAAESRRHGTAFLLIVKHAVLRPGRVLAEVSKRLKQAWAAVLRGFAELP